MKILSICANLPSRLFLKSINLIFLTLQQAQGCRKISPPVVPELVEGQRGELVRDSIGQAIILSLFASLSISAQVQLHTHPIDATHTALTLEFDLDEYDGVYEQYLHINTDSPAIKLSALHYPSEPTTKYVESFKESKSLFMGPCTVTGLLEETDTINDDAHLYVTYQLYSEKHPRTVAFPLHHKKIQPLATALDTQGEVKTTPSSTPLNLAERKSETLETLKEPAPYINPLLLSLLCGILGLFLLARASYSAHCTWRSTLSIIGMALLATSIVVGAKAYQDRYHSLHAHSNNPNK